MNTRSAIGKAGRAVPPHVAAMMEATAARRIAALERQQGERKIEQVLTPFVPVKHTKKRKGRNRRRAQ